VDARFAPALERDSEAYPLGKLAEFFFPTPDDGCLEAALVIMCKWFRGMAHVFQALCEGILWHDTRLVERSHYLKLNIGRQQPRRSEG
jgi:hypothetical protein